MEKYKKKLNSCPVEKTLSVIGNKWTVLIIRELLTGKKRFGELLHFLSGISPRTLSARVTELEKFGVLRKKTYLEVPSHTEYSLTKKGHELVPIIEQMAKWGIKYK